MNKINKIIYFDKETINNILQESNKGEKSTQTGVTSSKKSSGEISAESSIKLSLPFLKRLGFLFSGRISASYILEYNKTTTITSTEISDFETIKSLLIPHKKVKINDIENSSTFFRVAGGYLNLAKGDVEGVDVKEFKNVMDEFDGYDTYRICENKYIRFNNSAFMSNYKRNDLLTTIMDVYCISVGEFKVSQFDFIKQIEKMQTLLSGVDTPSTLAEKYPLQKNSFKNITVEKEKETDDKQSVENIELYDVLYASISGDRDE